MKLWLTTHEAYVYRTKGFKTTKLVTNEKRNWIEPITKQPIERFLWKVR